MKLHLAVSLISIVVFLPSLYSQRRYEVISGFSGDDSRTIYAGGDYIENQYKYETTENLDSKFDILLGKLSSLEKGSFRLEEKIDKIRVESKKQSNTFINYALELEEKLDSILESSQHFSKILESNEYYDFMGTIGTSIELSQNFRTTQSNNGNYLIDLRRNRNTDKFLFENDFSDDLAPFFHLNCWGYVNSNGFVVIPCKYQKAYKFSEGLAPVFKNSRWFYIDSRGEKKITLKEPTINALPFYRGLALVIHNSKFGSDKGFIIDKNGDIQHEISIGYGEELVWSDGRYHIFMDEYESGYGVKKEYRLLSHKGNEIIETCDYIGKAPQGIALFKTSSGYGFYDCNANELLIEDKYFFATDFCNDLAVVKIDKKRSTIINTNDAALIPIAKQKITRISRNQFEISSRKFKSYGTKGIITINESGECISGNCYLFNAWLQKFK